MKSSNFRFGVQLAPLLMDGIIYHLITQAYLIWYKERRLPSSIMLAMILHVKEMKLTAELTHYLSPMFFTGWEARECYWVVP